MATSSGEGASTGAHNRPSRNIDVLSILLSAFVAYIVKELLDKLIEKRYGIWSRMMILFNEFRRRKNTMLTVNGLTTPFLCEALVSYSYAQPLSLITFIPPLVMGLGISLLSSLVIGLLMFRYDKPSWNPSRREEACIFLITTIFPVIISLSVLDYVEEHGKDYDEIPIVKISPHLKRDGRRYVNMEWCYPAPTSEEFCIAHDNPKSQR